MEIITNTEANYNYKQLYDFIKKIIQENDIELKEYLEDLIYNTLKRNNFIKSDYKELIGIKLSGMDYPTEDGFAYTINDKYRVICKDVKDYNSTHYNTIMLLETNINYTIFGAKEKKQIVDKCILSDDFLRKIKIKRILDI